MGVISSRVVHAAVYIHFRHEIALDLYHHKTKEEEENEMRMVIEVSALGWTFIYSKL